MHKLTLWAAHLLHSIYYHGAEHVFISPGSRSTPLAIAAVIHPDLEHHVILDERSAAFTALGAAKVSNRPSVLICTSGTAAANYLPAIVEAKESGVPLIALTADRPPNLRNLGSSQTIDQLKLYGDHTVLFHEAGEPSEHHLDFDRLWYLGKQAVEISVEKNGCVHINLPFRKPLEPDDKELEEVVSFYKSRSIKKKPVLSYTNSIQLSDEVIKGINQSKRPILIAGPSDPALALNPAIEKLSSLLRAPVIAEPGSNVPILPNSVTRFEQVLRKSLDSDEAEPDLILRFGDQPYTKPVLNALSQWRNIPVIRFTGRSSPQDHAMSLDHEILCRPNDVVNLESIHQKKDFIWTEKWLENEKISQVYLDKILANDLETLTDGHVIRTLSKQLTGDWQTMISNSFAPRDMALFGYSKQNQFVNRGAAGIDGITSTGLGIALSSKKPTCCITGDLAFLHDSNALLSVKFATSPFIIAIINNGGGTIFRMLPLYNSLNSVFTDELFNSVFETPQNVNIENLAKASSLQYSLINTIEELHSLNLRDFKQPAIVEFKTDPVASMSIRNTLWNN